MSELLCLELSVVLWFVYLFTQILTSRAEFGDAWLFTPRDETPPPKGLACGRGKRALANYIENWVPFVAVDLALSYDHRIVDGREAVTFLVRVKEALEDPARLVLDL